MNVRRKNKIATCTSNDEANTQPKRRGESGDCHGKLKKYARITTMKRRSTSYTEKTNKKKSKQNRRE
jgi:hypothetical protein